MLNTMALACRSAPLHQQGGLLPRKINEGEAEQEESQVKSSWAGRSVKSKERGGEEEREREQKGEESEEGEEGTVAWHGPAHE